MSKLLDGKRILITGGTGSLGQAVTRRLLYEHNPKQIIIFSRDELKQFDMRVAFKNDPRLYFKPGDVRNYHSIAHVVSLADIVINTAAMKRVEVCERNVVEAENTNFQGAANIVQAILEMRLPVQVAVNIASDKGAKPLNVYGMSKALQERVFITANNECPWTRYVGVRYGNVMGSRGSVVPIWLATIERHERIYVSHPEVTRFLISLDQAVDTILAVLEFGERGDVYVPKIPAAKLGDMAKVICNGQGYDIHGLGPGEKMHETLVTDEEAERTIENGKYYVITEQKQKQPALSHEYISHEHLIPMRDVADLFLKYGFIKEKVAA